MDSLKHKDVLTTGQVARLCNVAPRTVSKWFDSGQLRGYRIPGSKDRRIPLQQLIRFMKAHGIPLNGIETGQTRVLIVDNDEDFVELLRQALTQEGLYDVRTASTAFEAGTHAQSFHPHVILLDISLPDVDPRAIGRLITTNPDLQDMRLIAMGSSISEGESQALRQQGFDNIVRKPFDVRQVMRAIEEARSVMV
jgi:excisionase family DNA binding protein